MFPTVSGIGLAGLGLDSLHIYIRYEFEPYLTVISDMLSLLSDYLNLQTPISKVDQLFSILAKEFKHSEIKSLPELMKIICDSPIKPKPTCESLWWTWDWKSFIEEKLSDKELSNHSFYNCFQIKKEDGKTKLRAKPLPQDSSWTPETGI